MNLLETKKIYSVTQLTKEIKFLFESSFPFIWIQGEISNLKQPFSGHKYFTLKDKGSQISCVMFKFAALKIKFALEDGMQILCCGRVSIYEKQGNYQIYVDIVQPQGKGALQLAFEQLKKKLAQEGLFDKETKQDIPSYPQKIGVVTSATGAAIRDILNVINRRFSHVHVLIAPVRVQGKEASGEIAQAIEDFNTYANVDVLIVGRGGGSIEDLWAFNEEVVARAIFNSQVPIISAVGHEVDWTIADFVADLRAPTPSAAAELVIGKQEDIIGAIRKYNEVFISLLQRKIELGKEKLEGLNKSYVLRNPQRLVEQKIQRIDDLSKQLQKQIGYNLIQKKNIFSQCVSKLEALNPIAILSRGYSVTKDANGVILRNSNSITQGDEIITQFCKGIIKSKVL